MTTHEMKERLMKHKNNANLTYKNTEWDIDLTHLYKGVTGKFDPSLVPGFSKYESPSIGAQKYIEANIDLLDNNGEVEFVKNCPYLIFDEVIKILKLAEVDLNPLIIALAEKQQNDLRRKIVNNIVNNNGSVYIHDLGTNIQSPYKTTLKNYDIKWEDYHEQDTFWDEVVSYG